nr:reverse transcriptase domain-containing protein [Tanacetum cinerariifolium]
GGCRYDIGGDGDVGSGGATVVWPAVGGGYGGGSVELRGFSEEETSRKGWDQGMPEPGPEAQNRGTIVPNHRGRRVWKEGQCSKDWRNETEIASEKHRHKKEYSRRTKAVLESERSAGGHWKSKPKKQKSSMEDDLSQPWVCEETDPFTPRIHYFDFPKTRMPSNIKTYDRSKDPEDHLKIFQAAAKTKHWAMPTWCHMFNSTLTENARVWFDDLPKESIDIYDDLRKAFLKNYLQQKECIKDPIEIHNIKQRNGESTEEFVRRYKLECRDRLYDKIPKSMDEMMSVTATFLKGEMAASNRERKKSFPSWKQEAAQKQNFKRGNFWNEQRMERKQDRFTLLTKTPREILALDKWKFKPPPSMTTPVEKRNASKFCEFHGEKRSDKDSKEGGNLMKRQTAGNINGATMAKDSKANDHSNFLLGISNFFPNPRGRRRDGSKFRPEIKNQLIPANTPLVGFSEEIIWPLGQISLLVRICDEEHSTSARMNFMVVRSPFPYNGIIRRPGVRNKFPVAGGIVTLQSSRIILLECSMVSEPKVLRPDINQIKKEKIQVAIHPEHPEQTVAIGSTLMEEGRKELCGLLRRHLNVFAWKPADMTGVPRHIAEHRLNVREGCLPVRQKKMGQAPERNKTISEEVKKLVEADIMKEVHYHSWLSNPVMVKKHDDSWRMCMDFKDLNKACPKDGYLLPKIDLKEDEEKTTFITSQGILCYLKMPFGLKNAGATYQRLEDKAFQKQIGRNLEVYVDDLVIKSRTKKEVIKDAEETFKTLRKINMKLNPKKCAFGMREGTFLGYKVDADGLRVSSDKVKADLDLPSSKCLKDVQKLNGKLAKGVFKEMKQSIAKLPMLTAPKEKEELIIYLAAVKEAINALLMTERDGKQVPIYFVSRALQGPEINYTPMEKLILALYRPRTSVKGQILADFIVERPEDGTPDTPMEDREELPDPWILFTDGSSCVDGFEAGLIIMNPKGMEFTYALRFRFNATNNEAEYEALIAGLRISSQMGIQNLQANVDSKLVANQVNEIYTAKESSMIRYLEKVKNLASTFKGFSIKQIPRGENKKAGALSKVTSTSFAHLSKQVLVEELREKAIDEKVILAVEEEEGNTWMTPVYEYLTEGILSEEKKKARTVRRKAGRYAMINEVLYKKSFLSLWLWCIGPLQANYVLREIHKGSCSMHAGPRSVMEKALRSGSSSRAKKSAREADPHHIPMPFYKWGIDIAGPFSEGPDKSKHEPRRGNQGTVGGQNKNWVEEVSHVLWAHRTMIKSRNRETPFSLTYGAEAVIPAKIGMPTLRIAEVDMAKNNEALGISLDLLEEKKEQAAIQEARNKAKMKGYYNARVRRTSFRPGDFVYRNNEASHAKDGGKLGPKWEGLYEVIAALGKGAYKLRDRNGHTLPRTWNIRNLKKCYIHEM